MSPLKPSTVNAQTQLAKYCREGELVEIEGAARDRIATYRRLVFSVVSDALVRSYPLTKALLTEIEWANLVHDFFELHKCADPQVWKMPFELIDFVKEKQEHLQEKYPQLIDLMGFEWIEIELYMMPDKPFPKMSCNDPMNEPWVFNPEHQFIILSYPVHDRKANLILSEDKGTYHVLAFRHPHTGSIHFTKLNNAVAEVLTHLASGRGTLKEYLKTSNHFDTNWLSDQMLNFFQVFKAKGLLM